MTGGSCQSGALVGFLYSSTSIAWRGSANARKIFKTGFIDSGRSQNKDDSSISLCNELCNRLLVLAWIVQLVV